MISPENHPNSVVSKASKSLDREEIAALKTEDLSFYYGNRKALEGISMEIYQNKITAIIGSSGCGKSTFLKALNRICELENQVRVTGKVEFYGQDIYGKRINLNLLRRKIGMVFQRPNPFPISIYENVIYGVKKIGRKSRSELDIIVESALQDAALWDEVKDSLKKSALGLSGGQQ
ncbi:MAG: ATP-binding cassette domain-containing protein, partial [Geitlerinemataceae cyanobacterium]